MCMQPVPWPEPDPQVAEAIEAMYGSRKTERPLAVVIRGRLGEWLKDEEFAAVFGIRGRPGWPPSRLALVTILQRAEKLTDRLAAEAVRTRIDWKYLLGLAFGDAGFDHTVLVQNHTRTITNGREVIKRREKEPEGDGLPPGHARIASPYDTDARWGVKREEFWLGYKLHVTETCDDPPPCSCRPGAAGQARPGVPDRGHDKGCAHLTAPNLITHVALGSKVLQVSLSNSYWDRLGLKT